MQAIILAGGKGTRLRPYTTTFPKSLVPVGDYPILEIILRQLKKDGFDKIILAVGHLSSLIQAYFGNGDKWGIDITYSYEDTPMGTAGPLRKITHLEDNFLVLNSDDLTDLNYKEFFNNHCKSDAAITISRYIKKVKIDFGVVQTDNEGKVQEYIEKPEYTFGVSMGIYAFKRESIQYIPENSYFDFPQLIKKLISEKIKVQCIDHEGLWLDIGRPDDYDAATQMFDNIKSKIL